MKSVRPDFTPRRLALGIAMTSLLAGGAPPAFADSADTLEEVIVTARKRQESLQEAPVAVSALSGAQIASLYAQSIRDLEGMSPNLIVDRVQATPGGAAISIRGVSFQDLEKSFDPAVGVVVDGIYLGTNTGAMLQVFDMDRIEVLRGPQGTLFGKNTIGGTINVLRTRPTGEFDAKVRARGGSDDRAEFEGVVMFPILEDMLAGKLSYVNRKQDGWVDNITTGDTAGDLDYEQFGAALRFTPSEKITVDFSYDRIDDTSAAAALSNANGPTDLFCLPLNIITGDPYVPPGQCPKPGSTLTGDYYKVAQNFSDKAYLYSDAYTLAVNWELSEGWTLDYLLGYIESQDRMDQDFDASPVDQFSTKRMQDYQQTSNELRLSYDNGGRFSMVSGAYLWSSEYQLGQRTFYLFDILAAVEPALAALKPGRPITQLQATDHSDDSWALFAEADYKLTDTLTLTLGGRYTEEEKEMGRAAGLNLGSLPAAWVGSILPSPPFATSFVHGSGVYPESTGAVLQQFSTFGDKPDENWSKFTPKAGLRWMPNDEQMFYISYTTGFRSGGFNGRAGALSSAETPYDEETVDSYELGWKANWLENRLQTAVTLFTTNYDDKQEEIVVQLPDGDQETVTQNASSATMSGAEFEVIAMITDAWTVRANAGYLDASYDDFCADVDGPSATPPPVPKQCGTPEELVGGKWIVPTDNSNLELRRAPEWTYSLDSAYVIAVGPGNLTLQASYAWKDDYYTTFQNVPLGLSDSYGLLDASIAYEWGDWRIAAFGSNLTDEEYNPSALVVAGLFNFQTVGQDRAYGAEISYHFSAK